MALIQPPFPEMLRGDEARSLASILVSAKVGATPRQSAHADRIRGAKEGARRAGSHSCLAIRVPDPEIVDVSRQPLARRHAPCRGRPADPLHRSLGRTRCQGLGRGLVGDALGPGGHGWTDHRGGGRQCGHAAKRLCVPGARPLVLRFSRTAEQDRDRGARLPVGDVRPRGAQPARCPRRGRPERRRNLGSPRANAVGH